MSEYDRNLQWSEIEDFLRDAPNWQAIKFCLAMAGHSWVDIFREGVFGRIPAPTGQWLARGVAFLIVAGPLAVMIFACPV